MRTVDLIQKKRDGLALTESEINYLIKGYSRGVIPDYQMAAWAMSVYYQGMTSEETAYLTMAMVHSGEQMDLREIEGIKVDKHSTGGVGDTTTLVLAPWVASAGVPVAKMSGRGLGHTGGTIDKLESIPGFHAELGKQQFVSQINQIGIALTGQSANITPADKKLYSLRDVTATVNSIPLIASSIMSKKLASGADKIVLDVKTGRGAFMKTLDESIALAKAMVQIGRELGRETMAVISQMDQPLGNAVGNAIEVQEAIDTLKGKGPTDLLELCLELGTHMLLAAKKATTKDEAKMQLVEALQSGRALQKMKEWIQAQGGNPGVVDDASLLPAAGRVISISSTSEGWVSSIDAEALGLAAMTIGAGRMTKESSIDLAVGIKINKKIGDKVKVGESIAELFVNPQREVDLQTVQQKVQQAYMYADQPQGGLQAILAVVTDEVEMFHA